MGYDIIIHWTNKQGQTQRTQVKTERTNIAIEDIQDMGGTVNRIETYAMSGKQKQAIAQTPGARYETIDGRKEIVIGATQEQIQTQQPTTPQEEPLTGEEILRQQLASGYKPKIGDVQTYPGGPITTVEQITPGQYRKEAIQGRIEGITYLTQATRESSRIESQKRKISQQPADTTYLYEGQTITRDKATDILSQQQEKIGRQLIEIKRTGPLPLRPHEGTEIITRTPQGYEFRQKTEEETIRETVKSYEQLSPVEQAARLGTGLFLYTPQAIFDLFAGPGGLSPRGLTVSSVETAKKYLLWEHGLAKQEGVEKWVSAQMPWYENVIIPLGLGGILKVALPAAESASGLLKGIYIGMKAVGTGAVLTGLGVHMGYTAATQPKQLPSELMKTGWQFALIGVGYETEWISPETTRLINQFAYGMKQTAYEHVPLVKDIDLQLRIFQEQAIMSKYPIIRGYAPSLSSRFKNIFFDTETLRLREMAFEMRREPMAIFGERGGEGAVSLEQLKGRGVREPFWYGEHGLTEYEILKDVFKEQQALKMRLEGLRNIEIKTDTIAWRMPDDPNKIVFISMVKDQDIFAIGKVKGVSEGKGLTRSVIEEGNLYYKLGKENLWYQRKPITGESWNRFLGEKGKYQVYESLGWSQKGKEVTLPILDKAGRWVSEKTFYDINEFYLSRGRSFSRLLYEGEKTITEKGFLAERKTDVELIGTTGEFKGRIISGRYIDEAKIFSPKLKGKESYRDTMGFDLSGIKETILDTLFLPGGIGAMREGMFGDMTRLRSIPFDVGMTQKGKSVFIDETVYYSPYWAAVRPGLAVEKVSIIGQKPVSVTGLKIAPAIKTDQKIGEIMISALANISMQISAQVNIQTRAQIQNQQQINISLTSQQQQQIQLQQQITLQRQEQMASITSRVVHITSPFVQPQLIPVIRPALIISPVFEPDRIIKPPVIYDELEEIQEEIIKGIEEDAYDVYVKNRQYVHGEKKYPTTYRKVSDRPLSDSDAHSLLASILGNTAKASGKIVSVDGEPHPLRKKVDDWWNVAYQYDERPDGRIVEKTQYRINTIGELNEITRKGIEARTNKTVKSFENNISMRGGRRWVL